MNQETTTGFSVKTLCKELAGFRLTNSFLFPNFSLEAMMAEVISCRIIKDNLRRRIFYLKTPTEGYFLKCSTLVRSKDRWRHFLLPFRKWAEWRNLHRLSHAGIAAAQPVMKGENNASHPKMFFLLTEKIDGLPFKINCVADAAKIGEFAAILHLRGVFHADLHPDNIIMSPQGRLCLIDVQEVFFLPWMPRRLRVHNLAKIYFNLDARVVRHEWSEEFLNAYNQNIAGHIRIGEIIKSAENHQQRKYRSRSKRCFKNSTEFVVVKNHLLKGYKRREFGWGAQELQQALARGQSLKEGRVIYYQEICIKKHRRRMVHRDRCRASWKMSRELEVRGIGVPRALGYFADRDYTYFLSELMPDGRHLNDYLSSISQPWEKRRILKQFALWLRKIHDLEIRQRDFKSNNMLCRDGDFFLVDLDDVKIHRLKERHKIVNLAQLNASVSNAVTLRDRIRFYHFYAADTNQTRQQRRAVYRRVWDITRTKKTDIYDLDLEALWRRNSLLGNSKRTLGKS
jgi:tRNA A-37 threonylcarbamoyl transferase component Bud32